MFNKEQFIEDIKAMTVLELADLVKALEEEFGVSATAAVAVAGAASEAGKAGDAAGKTGVLEEVPPRNVAHSVSFPSFCFPHLRLVRKFTENNE